MQISAERYFAVPRETVWAALNDVDTLRRSIPGCEKLDWTNADTLAAEVRTKVGPLDSRFTGTMTLSGREPPSACRIAGQGQSGAAGFASGTAMVRLVEKGDGTMLSYQVEAMVGGKLAQLAGRLIDAAAARFADEFFRRLEAAMLTPLVSGAAELLDTPAARRPGLSPAVWIPVLIAFVFIMLLAVAEL